MAWLVQSAKDEGVFEMDRLNLSQCTIRLEFSKNALCGIAVHKQPLQSLDLRQRREHHKVPEGALYEYVLLNDRIYKENVQRRCEVEGVSIVFLLFERGNGENWDAVEETVWGEMEIQRFLNSSELKDIVTLKEQPR